MIGATLYVMPRLTMDSQDDRVVTLATAWGDGTSAPNAAHMVWYVGKATDHQVKGGGHWEKVVAAKKGDHVILTVSYLGPASCSITSHGAQSHGTSRCEILSLP